MRRGGYYPPLLFGCRGFMPYGYGIPYKNIKNFLSGMEIEFEIWYNKKVSVNERKAFDFYERIP